MLKDMEEKESSSTLSTERDTQQLMIHGLTMMTLTLQNSSKSSIVPSLWVDERYKYTPNSFNKSPSSNASKHSKNYYDYTPYTLSFTLPSTPTKYTQPPLRDPISFPSPPLHLPLLHRSLCPPLTLTPWPLLAGPPLTTCHAPYLHRLSRDQLLPTSTATVAMLQKTQPLWSNVA